MLHFSRRGWDAITFGIRTNFGMPIIQFLPGESPRSAVNGCWAGFWLLCHWGLSECILSVGSIDWNCDYWPYWPFFFTNNFETFSISFDIMWILNTKNPWHIKTPINSGVQAKKIFPYLFFSASMARQINKRIAVRDTCDRSIINLIYPQLTNIKCAW